MQHRLPLQAIMQPNVVAGMAFIFCTLLAIELIMVVYASWLARDFGATTAQLGSIFALLGFVEIGGSLGAALFTDRIGKRRAVIGGYLLTAPVDVGPAVYVRQLVALLPVFLLYDICFEFAVVSTFPLLSELLPQARGRVIAIGVATIGLGRVVGSLLGPALFVGIGFTANGVLAALLTLLGVAICARWVYEGSGRGGEEERRRHETRVRMLCTFVLLGSRFSVLGSLVRSVLGSRFLVVVRWLSVL
ncbi:MFS transporter, partial [Candidatus Gracilibacteria bacterium]|nr:MFS transporter [Candidatus Gracilibacteria bacterium]